MSGSRCAVLCGTSEMPRPRSACKPAPSLRTPSNHTRPSTVAFGSNSPITASARSVLPDPDAPTTATTSPACTDTLSDSMAWCGARFAQKKGAFGSYMSNETLRSSTCRR